MKAVKAFTGGAPNLEGYCKYNDKVLKCRYLVVRRQARNPQENQRKSELIVKSSSFHKKVLITNKDVKRYITSEDRERTKDQQFNEELYKTEIVNNIRKPNKIIQKKYQQKDVTFHLRKSTSRDTIVAVIDNKSKRLILNTKITVEKQNKLFDAKIRDFRFEDLSQYPQAQVINNK